MSELFDSQFLNKIERMVITTKLMISGGASGNRKSANKGSSVEFSDYREYVIGDDFRRIDWNAYARFEKFFIKIFMDEREAPVHIYLDTSKSMNWGNPSKSFVSRRLAAALGYIGMSNYDSVSVECLNKRVECSKVSMRGKNSFAKLLNFLEQVQYKGKTNLTAAIKESHIKSNRGISVIISDLFSPDSFEEALKFLQYKKQDVYVCHTLAPSEINPEVSENYKLIDSETGECMDVTASSALIKTYRRVYRKFTEDIKKTCFRRGMNYILLDTSVPVEKVLHHFTPARG